MFGYVRPLQGELKVRELERFKSCYCGLCHSLGKRYGLASRFILSYELVFLSMLLWPQDEPVRIKRRVCIASPCRARRCCERNTTLDKCAGYSVILTWWKLRDTVDDEPFFKALPHRLLLLILSRAYKKSLRDCPEFDGRVRNELRALLEYESQSDLSLDVAADKFAQILAAAAPEDISDQVRRPLLELLYHLGRWIYVIDACDDYGDDIKAGRFNPVVSRFPPDAGKLPDSDKSRIETTLRHSNNLLCSAFELLPETVWTDTIRNMIYLGMPDVSARVLDGKWNPRRFNYNSKEWA